MPDPTPQILESSNRFRQQLLARERRAATVMVRFYGQTWRSLQGDIRQLRADVEAQRIAGETITEGKLWRLERMQAIQQQVERELLQFSEFADQTITANQREAIAAAERNAVDLIAGAFPPDAGVEINFAQLPREAVEQLVGFLQDGSPLKDLLDEAVGEAADDFASTMVTGIAAGWNPRKLARELRGAFGMGLTRSLSIARTEQLRAYRTATLNTYQKNSDVVKEWERHATKDVRTCMACIMLDGKRYDLKTPMDDHVQGRCAMLPITKSYAELGIDAPEPDFSRELASDWFRRQSGDVQGLMMGPGAFKAWQDGLFKLEDYPRLIRSDKWGNSWVPKSLKVLLEVKPRPIGTDEQAFLDMVSETETMIADARAAGSLGEAEGMQSYIDEGVRPMLEQEQRINAALWKHRGLGADEATAADWAATAKGLQDEGNRLYLNYTKEGIRQNVAAQRGAKDAGYMQVGGQWVEVKRGAFSVRAGARMEGEIWAQAKEDLSGAMGEFLRQAGYSAKDISQASFEQRRKLLEELGNKELSRTKAGRVSKIDLVPEKARTRTTTEIPHDLAATAANSALDPLNVPTLDAYGKMELADLIRHQKLGR